MPQVIGVDGAGIVDEVDDDEALLQVGQPVVLYPGVTCGRCEFCRRGDAVLCTQMKLLGEHRDGTWAEFVSVPAANVLPMPAHLDFGEAAALGVNHLTAWRMLFTLARLKPWETVLIFCIGTGQNVAKAVMTCTGGRGVDVVIENVGAAVWGSAPKSLVRDGRIVTCGATSGDRPGADLRRLFIRQLQVYGSTLGNPGEFHDLLDAVATNRLEPVVDSRFGLADARDALSRLESERQFGKVVLELPGDDR